MGRLSGKKILMVIAPDQFRDEELFQPKEIFEKEGASVVVASTKKGTAKGMLGGKVEVFSTIYELTSESFDAVVIVGGMGSPTYLWNNEELHRLIKRSFEESRVIGAICLSGAVLAKAGILKGVRATVYPTKESLSEMEKGGSIYVKKDVVVDGRIVTASGPHVARDFGMEIVKLLSG